MLVFRHPLLWAGLLATGASVVWALPSEIWARGFGGPGRERAMAVAPDRGGKVYCAGRIEGSASFGGSLVTSAGADALVMALDVQGRPLWAHAFGGPGTDEALSLAMLPNGDLFVVGAFSETADVAPGAERSELMSAGGTDVFVLRLTREGALVWARRLGGPQEDRGLDVAVDARGLWVAGSFQGTLDAGTTRLAGTGQTDGFLARLDLAGTTLWVKGLGGSQDDAALSVAVEANGTAWVAGSFEGEMAAGASGTPPLVSTGKADGFLVRVSPEGGVLGGGRIGGKGDDAATAV
ncbi:MAG TPA: hypothetical protein DD490_21710, partial [Acidobacteria bacterium]|nr:hypothetical protein [Acidobacteriota bacterium]